MRSTRAISSQVVTIGCLLTTRSKHPSRKGKGPSSATWTTKAPEGARRRAAISRFGGQDSVAATTRGGRAARPSTSPKTSPPPVSMSSTAAEWPTR